MVIKQEEELGSPSFGKTIRLNGQPFSPMMQPDSVIVMVVVTLNQ